MNMTKVPTLRAKKPKPQAILNVFSIEDMSPRMRRIGLEGPGVAELAYNPNSDSYVKLLLPRPGTDREPPFDLDYLRAHEPESMPAIRTYTVRRWDLEAKRIWIDVVIHNEPDHTGIASDWATNVRIGDSVAMRGAGGAYTPRADATQHVLIGDHAALPAIAASLEAMHSHARGYCRIHLDHAEDILADLTRPAGIDLEWVIGDRELLLRAVETLKLDSTAISDGTIHVFCHAERGLTKQLRAHLVGERGVARGDISISAYWALGRVEDQFQAEKREAIGRIDPA